MSCPQILFVDLGSLFQILFQAEESQSNEKEDGE
jgi:hypothetical protein